MSFLFHFFVGILLCVSLLKLFSVYVWRDGFVIKGDAGDPAISTDSHKKPFNEQTKGNNKGKNYVWPRVRYQRIACEKLRLPRPKKREQLNAQGTKESN